MKKNKDTKSKLEDLKKQLESSKEQESLIPVSESVAFDDDDVLNAKQLKFCVEYSKTNRGTASAIAAGYSKQSARHIASRLLTKDNIQEEIRKRKELLTLANNITKEYVQKQLIELIQDSYTDDKVDRTSILKALDMLNKMNGLYTPEQQINIQNNGDSEIKIIIVKPDQTE